MAEKSIQKRVQQSISVCSSLGILSIGLIVSLVSILPLYSRLKEGMENNLSHAVKIRTMAVDEYLSRAKDIALQITSRTQIRKRLESYNRGEIRLDELVKYTHGKLSDAMKLSEEVAGISRLSPTGRLLVEVGLPLPERALWPVPSDNSKDVIIHGSIIVGKESYLLVGAHIFGEKPNQAGTDIILFKLDRLRRIVENYTGLGKTGETILGVSKDNHIQLFFPLRTKRYEAAKTLQGDSPIALAIGKSFQKRDGITISKDLTGTEVIIAYGPVQGVQWGIAVKMDTAELYSPLNRQIILISSIIIVLILFGTFSIVKLLRPLTGALEKELTERKQAEAALRESRERFRNLVETTSDWVWEVDENNVYTYVSPKIHDILGYEPEDVLGKTPFDLMPPEEAKRVADIFSPIAASQEPIKFLENTNLHKDGHPVILETSGEPIFHSDGTFRGYRGIDRDITERKQAEDEKRKLQLQLLQSQKLESVGRLAGGVAHDFNNLLSAILGYCEMSLEEMPDDNPLKENIRIIYEAGEKAKALTWQLLAFSRKQVLEIKVVNLNAIIENMGKMLAIIGEDILLELNTRSPVKNVMADSGQIEQIMINLAVNARDAMPGGGRLIIETADVELDEEYAKSHQVVKPGSYVMLSVTDDEEGMSREVQERIFEPFFTTKDTGKGSGLGLSIVYGIVKQHKGYIWCYSEPGKGTTFNIYLPVAKAEVEEAAEKKKITVIRGTETVLMVEDEPSIRKLILDMLQPLGYRLLEASCGEEALQISDTFEGKIDLVLTDVIMPGMNGRELADAFKSRRPEAKVIFMSGYTDNTIAHHGVLEPGMAFIPKPLTRSRLADKLREVLDIK